MTYSTFSRYGKRFPVFGGFMLALLLAFAMAPQVHAQTPDQQETAPDAVVHVKGMACQMCARSMTNSLETLDAVEKADVKLEEQKALLTFKDGESVTEEKLRKTVEDAGYQFRKVVFPEEKTGGSESSDAK